MSTLPIAASAAHHGHPDLPAWAQVAIAIYFGSIALTWVLFGIVRVMPAGRWRNRLHATQILLCCLSSFRGSDNDKFVWAQTRNLYAVWRKTHVGAKVVVLFPDGDVIETVVAKTWWDSGNLAGSFANNGWANVGDLFRYGQASTTDGGWFFTPERWVTAEPELRAFQEEQRRQHAATQHAAFSKEIMDALAVLGLTPAATIDDVTAARNRMMQAHHPDHGGSTAAAQRINAAHDFLRSAVRQAA